VRIISAEGPSHGEIADVVERIIRYPHHL
jgi:hypothetical protein